MVKEGKVNVWHKGGDMPLNDYLAKPKLFHPISTVEKTIFTRKDDTAVNGIKIDFSTTKNLLMYASRPTRVADVACRYNEPDKAM